MMTIQALGLLGLLGLLVLLLIYVLKPNFQQKIISSTFVWKLSLKYKKRQIPISKLRNILLIACQILIISTCAFALARPLIVEPDNSDAVERIVILDASVNMRAQLAGKTRFERALEDISEIGAQTFAEFGKITVICAAETVGYVTLQAETQEQFDADMQKMDLSNCTYTQGDVEGAIAVAQLLLEENPHAKVSIYTATRYNKVRNMEEISYADDGAWNAAVLDVSVEIVENYYTFTIEVASYNSPQPALPLHVEIRDALTAASEEPSDIEISDLTAVCVDNQSDKVVIDDRGIYEFSSIAVTIPVEDSFTRDNTYIIYGGKKDEVRIQYASPVPNAFFRAATQSYRSGFSDRYAVSTMEIDKQDPDQVMQFSGYDFYIFEHEMPVDDLPTDGVVMLVNPDVIPEALSSEVELDANLKSGVFNLTSGDSHPIMSGIRPGVIQTQRFRPIVWHENTFTPLLYCDDDPILIVKNTSKIKIVILSIDVRFSQMSVLPEFPQIMYNIFDYFVPATMDNRVLDVGDTITLNSRGSSLSLNLSSGPVQFENLPTKYVVTAPGAYEVTQTLLSDKISSDNFFVKIARKQSDFARIEDEISGPYVAAEDAFKEIDLLVFLAAALVLLLFVEWYLHTRERS